MEEENKAKGSAFEGGALPELGYYLPPKRKTTPAWIRTLF